MSDASSVLKMIKDKEVKFIDFRFTDPRGKWQHVALDATYLEEEHLVEGIMFDGSSIAGWKVINESDMTLMPDLTTATLDPFMAQTTLVLFCDVLEPATGEPYERCRAADGPRDTSQVLHVTDRRPKSLPVLDRVI